MINHKNAAKILIVDDNKTLRTVLSLILRDEGYEVIGELSNGENFILTVERLRPDIIFLDQDLPGSNGLYLLRQLHEKHVNVAVVMITGETDPAFQLEAVESGVDGFIKKPFNQVQIIFELQQVEHARKLLDKKYVTSQNPQKSDINILIADDSSIMREVLSIILKNMGLNVVGEARSGTEAVSMVTQFNPQALCLDLDMPEMDGMEALRQIKANNPDIRIIIVSGHSERDLVKRAIELGACGYIVKPYDAIQVEVTLRSILML